jgi:hypothetical protein
MHWSTMKWPLFFPAGCRHIIDVPKHPVLTVDKPTLRCIVLLRKRPVVPTPHTTREGQCIHQYWEHGLVSVSRMHACISQPPAYGELAVGCSRLTANMQRPLWRTIMKNEKKLLEVTKSLSFQILQPRSQSQ